MAKLSNGAIELLATIRARHHTSNVWRRKLKEALKEQQRLSKRDTPKSVGARIRFSDAKKRAQEKEVQAREGIDKEMGKIGILRRDFAVEAQELDDAGYLFYGEKGMKDKTTGANIGLPRKPRLSQRSLDRG